MVGFWVCLQELEHSLGRLLNIMYENRIYKGEKYARALSKIMSDNLVAFLTMNCLEAFLQNLFVDKMPGSFYKCFHVSYSRKCSFFLQLFNVHVCLLNDVYLEQVTCTYKLV